MANPEHLEILKKGVEFWNRWRRENWPHSEQPDLRGAALDRADLRKVNLGFADLSNASLWEAKLNEANLNNAALWEARLVQADLTGADLSNARLKGANFGAANLSGATLHEADFSNVGYHLPDANLSGANLSEANLSEVRLDKTNLIKANLTRANLKKADLWEADLREADLSKADLSEANLSGALFWRANLSDALLKKTSLSRTILSETILQGTDFSQARMGGTYFGDIDLRFVRGLNEVSHRGPSTIGMETIARSQGNIPETFLRGCGLSDVQIEMAKLHNPALTEDQITDITYKIHELLAGDAIKYNSCFISFSHNDRVFVQQLYKNLQDRGVRCWFAPEDMKIGDKIRPTIDQSIRLHDKLLVVLSEHSMVSEWVEDEVENALDLEKERQEPVLFPIRLDDAVMESTVGWAAKIKRSRHIGDFCNWKDNDAYQQALERLLRDLKAEG